MDGRWRFNLFRLRLALLPFLCLLLHPDFCWSLNAEEKVVRDPFNALSNWNSDHGEEAPCSWMGVECYNGKVETLIVDQVGDISSRKLLQATPIDEQNIPISLAPPLSPSPSPSPSPPPSDLPSFDLPSPSPTSIFLLPPPTEPAFPVPVNTPNIITAPPPFQSAPIPHKKSSWLRNRANLLLGTIGSAVFIFILSLSILIC